MLVDLPVTPGDLLDRRIILELKRAHRPGDAAVARLHAAVAQAAARGLPPTPPGAEATLDELREVNRALWDAETRVRQVMALPAPAPAQLAEIGARIARLNDRRGALKAALDAAFVAAFAADVGPAVTEPKFY